MPKVALVLSGGGAKGAFQVMAEKYAREMKGYKWDIIAGVSIGALNGMMFAMGKYGRLEDIWNTITSDKVYTGKINSWAIVKILLGAKSVLGHKPLWKLINEEYEPNKFNVDLRVGTVSLETGKYKVFRRADYGFDRAILASTAIPIVWPPVKVSPSHQLMVDGGVRNISPLGDVLDDDPDEIVVINCSPPGPTQLEKPLKNALEIGRRTLDIALNEIFVTDLREFLRINHNVKQVEGKPSCDLTNEEGKPYKYYEAKVIQPDEHIGDTLDFSRDSIDKLMEAGWEKAKQVLG